MSNTRATLRTTGVAFRSMLVATLVLGVAYTLFITLIGQLVLPWQANGSPLKNDAGSVVGSALVGQSFTNADGDGSDGGASSGSNWGPENADLIAAIGERRAAVAELEGVPESAVPADAVTASSSGLDPHISVAYADLQIARVADARGLTDRQVADLVAAHTTGRDLGYLGEPRVNVVELNLALDELAR